MDGQTEVSIKQWLVSVMQYELATLANSLHKPDVRYTFDKFFCFGISLFVLLSVYIITKSILLFICTYGTNSSINKIYKLST